MRRLTWLASPVWVIVGLLEASSPAHLFSQDADPLQTSPPPATAQSPSAAAAPPQASGANGDTISDPSSSEASSATVAELSDDAAARQARIKDLLSLVTDNSLFNHKRENPAYFALVHEVLRQTPEELRSLARENPKFNDFYHKPAEHRGEVVHLAINLRRVLPLEINVENEAGVTRLYELWGWTDEAKAWMYCCITPELPPGLPREGDVSQRVELTGYFFKMQAYQPGDAAPNARNLVAPVVIGRVTSAPKQTSPITPGMSKWPLLLVGGFGLIFLFRLLLQVRNFTKPLPTHRNYRRRSLEAADSESNTDATTESGGLKIRNADE